MKNIYILCLLLSTILYEETYSQTYRLETDTLIATGVRYKKFAESSKPWEIFVLEADLTNPLVKIQSVKSSDKLKGSFQEVSAMASTHHDDYHKVIGAVNADFFSWSTQNPINTQVMDGEILWDYSSPRSVIGITADNIPFTTYISQLYKVSDKDGNYASISHINKERGSYDLVLYNQYYGSSTKTDGTGQEVEIQSLGGPNAWAANDTIKCTVLKKGVGNMSITPGNAILSGTSLFKSFLENKIAVNDTISLILKLSSSPDKIKQLIGSFPKIVNNGVNYAATGVSIEGDPGHGDARHPRTGAGFSQDKSTFYLVVVDGRSDKSIGMTFNELADFMIYLGVYTGVNFDGGGSSTMVVNHEVKNVPSGGTERSVANALLVCNEQAIPVLSEPKNGEIINTDFVNFSWDYYTNARYQLQISRSLSGWNKTEGFKNSVESDTIIVVNHIDTLNSRSYTWKECSAGSYNSPLIGTYYWTVRAWTNPLDTSYFSFPSQFNIDVPTSSGCLNTVTEKLFSVYPNPFKDILLVKKVDFSFS